MYILGINAFFHDSAATLLKDGVVVAAAEEERFTRKKHDPDFPIHAIRFCLENQNISIADIGLIAYYEKPLLKFERLLYQCIDTFPKSARIFLKAIPGWFSNKLNISKIIKKKLRYRGDVVYIDHHRSHAASAFYPSPFRQAAVVTIDGVGEWSTATYGVGIDNTIDLYKEICFPHSLGLLYSTITAYLGFSVNNSEYKVMGLSAYGDMKRETNPYYASLQRVVDIKSDGSFCLDLDYFTYHFSDRMPSKKLCALLGGSIRRGNEDIQKRHKDIAAAIQMITEDIVCKILSHVHAVTGQKNLVMAGGVALNSVLNGKILANTPFERLWIQPNASDGGTSMGAALFANHGILENKRAYEFHNPYLGPSFSDQEIEKFLCDRNITYSRFTTQDELLSKASRLLFENHIVGWFQGGMEWGPRALGARSILANPCDPDIKEILNVKVKHREQFRPFAPAICIDDADTFFECDSPIPAPTDYMLMVYPIREEWRNKIPGVVHVDGSGRLQTVRRDMNPLYFDLIKNFGALTGIPIIINTSFNIRGEPIVCTPHDAYRCMMGTGIDCLIINNFIVYRADNLRDEWDSETCARD